MPPVNGRELTSEDVKYSIERQMTNQPGKFQHAYFFLTGSPVIETPDKYTIVFRDEGAVRASSLNTSRTRGR